ncbi:uncharacterized protein TRAVEDRAFT_42517 [Trametes versicolor FP-101664 SS1]|uniref:uncharacterized protein n=1 Tax=Trametes versicolor (strain FP-101664) TaxID=717944 RepID=UPI0004622F2B|nr:uncharacterized protein TRAVEDRAFT_42517 [Trametes versicolor FP-101664 SS1]EIW65133.1 hypothetical protein TRAVEDRAFT_42517 [Trametes versicolor FP-101664 SS1]
MLSWAIPAFAVLLCLLVCLLRCHRRSSETSNRTPGFIYYATTTLRQHHTTNLELLVPLPTDYAAFKPTILRDFGKDSHTDLGTSHLQGEDIPQPSRSSSRRPTFVIQPCALSPDIPISPPTLNCAPPSESDSRPSTSRGEPAHMHDVDEVDLDGSQDVSHATSTANRQGSPGLILIRHPNTRSVDGETYDSPFFEIEGTNPVDSPPDFTPDEDVQLGDVFYYRYKGNSAKSRLWIWCFDTVQGVRNWKRVKIGQRREDGRRLTLSESRKNPSWVSKAWFARRGIQNRL